MPLKPKSKLIEAPSLNCLLSDCQNFIQLIEMTWTNSSVIRTLHSTTNDYWLIICQRFFKIPSCLLLFSCMSAFTASARVKLGLINFTFHIKVDQCFNIHNSLKCFWPRNLKWNDGIHKQRRSNSTDKDITRGNILKEKLLFTAWRVNWNIPFAENLLVIVINSLTGDMRWSLCGCAVSLL